MSKVEKNKLGIWGIILLSFGIFLLLVILWNIFSLMSKVDQITSKLETIENQQTNNSKDIYQIETYIGDINNSLDYIKSSLR